MRTEYDVLCHLYRIEQERTKVRAELAALLGDARGNHSYILSGSVTAMVRCYCEGMEPDILFAEIVKAKETNGG